MGEITSNITLSIIENKVTFVGKGVGRNLHILLHIIIHITNNFLFAGERR